MNEQDLKDLWQAEQTQPAIDFAQIEKLSDDWRKRLRRKVKIDIWTQIAAAVVGVCLFAFYPGLLFFSLTLIPLCVWYVRELRGLYRIETGEAGVLPVRDALNLKIKTFKDYFRHTRFVMYAVTPLIIASALYGMGYFDSSSIINGEKTLPLIVALAVYDAIAFVATEVYFKILYQPALDELKNLREQLDSEE